MFDVKAGIKEAFKRRKEKDTNDRCDGIDRK